MLGPGGWPHRQDARRAPSQAPSPCPSWLFSVGARVPHCLGERGPFLLSHKSRSSAYTSPIFVFPFLLFQIISVPLLFLQPPPSGGAPRADCSALADEGLGCERCPACSHTFRFFAEPRPCARRPPAPCGLMVAAGLLTPARHVCAPAPCLLLAACLSPLLRTLSSSGLCPGHSQHLSRRRWVFWTPS